MRRILATIIAILAPGFFLIGALASNGSAPQSDRTGSNGAQTTAAAQQPAQKPQPDQKQPDTKQQPDKQKPQTGQKSGEQQKSEPPESQDETIKLSSRLVQVPVSASDVNGKPVKDLQASDIVIEENGKPQQVVALGEPGKTPVEIAMLFDVSGSTQRQFNFEQEAAIGFVKEVLKPGDDIALFSIGVTPKMVESRTTSGDQAIRGLMSIGPLSEPTAFFDTVVEAVKYLDKNADQGSRRVVVVISDGEENYSKSADLRAALRELQTSDCLFYSINPNGAQVKLNTISAKGQNNMESLASETGGKAFSTSNPEELRALFHQISEELQAQYLFGYYTDKDPGTVGFQRITVTAPHRPDLRIRARQGYYIRKEDQLDKTE